MKKIILLVLLIQGLVLAGCGSPSPPPVEDSVSGYIVDQSGTGVSGVKVNIGSNEVTTDSNGRFFSNSISPGNYAISGSGGSTGHYVVVPKTVTINAGANNLGNITAYKILGCGVIIQSPLSGSSMNAQFKNPTVKRITRGELDRSPVQYTPHPGNMGVKSVSPAFLNENISFILLNWEKLTDSWIDHYNIYYLGSDGSQNIMVWNSQDSHSGDPTFEPNDPPRLISI
jgi:hypothetical protein